MPRFRYDALDPSGRSEKGWIEAPDMSAAVRELKGRSLIPVDLVEESPSSATGWMEGRLGVDALASFSRRLAVLAEAGFTLEEALESLVEQEPPGRMRTVLSSLLASLREGKSLSEALSEWDDFGPLFTSMVAAGERSGALADVLSRLASYMEQSVKLRNKIVSALVYPALMIVVGLCVTGILVFYIAPTIVGIFEGAGVELPLPTRILVAAVGFVGAWWWLLLPGVSFLAAAAVLYFLSPSGRRRLHEISLRIPGVANVVLTLESARFARTMGVLLQGGVEVLEALEMSREVVANHLMREALERASEDVAKGGGLSSALASSGLFPRLLIDMCAAGHRTGRMAEMLLRAADAFDESLSHMLEMFTALLEPVVIVLMGGIVGFIVIAVVLPLMQMSAVFK